jgi:hypothetical protein
MLNQNLLNNFLRKLSKRMSSLQETISFNTLPAFREEYFNGSFFQSIFNHTESLKDAVHGITAKEFDIAIRLALEAIQTMDQSARTVQYKEALSVEIKKQVDTHETAMQMLQKRETAEKESIKSHYTTALMEMETELRNLKTTLAVNDLTIAKLREQVSQSESMFRASLDDVVRQKEQQYEKELARLTASHKQMMEMLESSAKERVEGLRAVYTESEEKLRKQLEKSLVSSEKGKQGEREFDELVAQYTTWGPLNNTAKTAHCTDRAGKIKNCHVLFEIKNYTGEVPSAEVEKFERDMEEHHDIPYGVFISMKTGIRGKKADGFLTTKWTSRSQLLVFINHFYSHHVEDVLKFIEMCADIAWTVYKGARDRPADSEQCVELQGRIESAKIFVEKEIRRMEQFLTQLDHDKKFLISTIQKQNTSYVYNITQSAESLRMMLGYLLGTDTGVKEDAEGLTPPPEAAVSCSNAAGGNGGGDVVPALEEISIVTGPVKKTRGGKKKNEK